MRPLHPDWWHECEECGNGEWGPLKVNVNGEHLDPNGGTCSGAIKATPPPNAPPPERPAA